ncbi:MAG UNVERIFIED_CONTAM: amidohydrolase family protein [Anaerolineae bacterium]
MTQLAQDDARIQGIVAVAPLEQTDYAQHLEQLQALPLVEGVRRLIQSEGAGFCTQPAFVRAVQALPRYGYSFDICVVHHQLGDVLELVAQCPQVAFVLDHLGKPPIREWGNRTLEG